MRDRLALVVNRANSGVSVKQIEQAVGLPAIAQIRSGGMLFVRAANEGKTVTDMFPKEKVTADFEHLADRLLGLEPAGSVPAPAPEKRRCSAASSAARSPFGSDHARGLAPPTSSGSSRSAAPVGSLIQARSGRRRAQLRSVQLVPPRPWPGRRWWGSPVTRSTCLMPRR